MKKILVGLLLALTSSLAFADGNSLIITQRNSADTGNILRTLANPPSDGLLIWNQTTKLPSYLVLGNGFVSSSGVLSVSPVPGPAGAQGATGATGKSAYQSAVDAGYTDSIAAWLASLKGADGAAGPAGQSIAGPQGVTGSAGASAYELAQVNGYTGTLQAWLVSLQGAAGRTGDAGAQGPIGPQGVQGVPGTPAPTFNFGLPVARTLALSTAYQASTPTKAAIVTVSPQCTASLTLTGGGTCTMQVRIGAAGLTCSTGTTISTWMNVNSGTLSVGLALNQVISSPYGINLPAGAYFILCPTAGTFTVSAVDQTAG